MENILEINYDMIIYFSKFWKALGQQILMKPVCQWAKD